MTLSNSDIQEIHKLMREAYTRRDEVKFLLSYQLGIEYADQTEESTRDYEYLNILKKAISQDWIDALLDGMLDDYRQATNHDFLSKIRLLKKKTAAEELTDDSAHKQIFGQGRHQKVNAWRFPINLNIHWGVTRGSFLGALVEGDAHELIAMLRGVEERCRHHAARMSDNPLNLEFRYWGLRTLPELSDPHWVDRLDAERRDERETGLGLVLHMPASGRRHLIRSDAETLVAQFLGNETHGSRALILVFEDSADVDIADAVIDAFTGLRGHVLTAVKHSEYLLDFVSTRYPSSKKDIAPPDNTAIFLNTHDGQHGTAAGDPGGNPLAAMDIAYNTGAAALAPSEHFSRELCKDTRLLRAWLHGRATAGHTLAVPAGTPAHPAFHDLVATQLFRILDNKNIDPVLYDWAHGQFETLSADISKPLRTLLEQSLNGRSLTVYDVVEQAEAAQGDIPSLEEKLYLSGVLNGSVLKAPVPWRDLSHLFWLFLMLDGPTDTLLSFMLSAETGLEIRARIGAVSREEYSSLSDNHEIKEKIARFQRVM